MVAPKLPRRARPRPPSLPKPPAQPRGARWEQKLRKASRLLSGPGQPPPNFVSGNTSAVEWVVYWALFKALAPQRDPRIPPFFGITGVFRYQKAFEGGREIGGSVVDFVIEYGPKVRRKTAIRIQTVQFHAMAPIRQQTQDRLRKTRIATAMNVVDLNDYDILNADGTAGNGEKAVVAVKSAIGMIEYPSRNVTGNVRDVRYRLAR